MTLHALYFDADRHDREIPWAQSRLPTPGERQLLWIDVEGEVQPAVAEVVERLNLGPAIQAFLETPAPQPALDHRDNHVLVNLEALEREPHRFGSTSLRIVAGQNVVITVHAAPVTFLHDFAGQLQRDSRLGELDAAAFLAVLLHRHLETYHQALGALEANH
ncbi:CorA family divalent cation transporter [Deinococcus sonorensis]